MPRVTQLGSKGAMGCTGAQPSATLLSCLSPGKTHAGFQSPQLDFTDGVTEPQAMKCVWLRILILKILFRSHEHLLSTYCIRAILIPPSPAFSWKLSPGLVPIHFIQVQMRCLNLHLSMTIWKAAEVGLADLSAMPTRERAPTLP